MRAAPEQLEALCRGVRGACRGLAAADGVLLAPLALTAGERALLEFLARQPGEVSLSALARRMSVSRQHVHQALARLPEPRWVVARPDPADARAVLLRLSSRGRAAWRRVHAIDRGFFTAVAPALDAAEVDVATRVIAALREAAARIVATEEPGERRAR